MAIGGQPEFDDVDVDLFTTREGGTVTACVFEEEGEGVFTGQGAESAHGDVKGESVDGFGSGGADKGVPHEGVGSVCGGEDSRSVGEVTEGGKGEGGE